MQGCGTHCKGKMSEMARITETIEETIKCPICFNRFMKPKGLPCGHTYCFHCLLRLCGQQKDVRCPQCRKLHKVPAEGPNGFADDHLMIKILNLRAKSNICQDCQKIPGFTLCEGCRQKLYVDGPALEVKLKSKLAAVQQDMHELTTDNTTTINPREAKAKWIETTEEMKEEVLAMTDVFDSTIANLLEKKRIVTKNLDHLILIQEMLQKVANGEAEPGEITKHLLAEVSQCKTTKSLLEMKELANNMSRAIQMMLSGEELDFSFIYDPKSLTETREMLERIEQAQRLGVMPLDLSTATLSHQDACTGPNEASSATDAASSPEGASANTASSSTDPASTSTVDTASSTATTSVESSTTDRDGELSVTIDPSSLPDGGRAEETVANGNPNKDCTISTTDDKDCGTEGHDHSGSTKPDECTSSATACEHSRTAAVGQACSNSGTLLTSTDFDDDPPWQLPRKVNYHNKQTCRTTIIGGRSMSPDKQLTLPVGAAYSAADDTVYVADSNNNRVMAYDVNGQDGRVFITINRPLDIAVTCDHILVLTASAVQAWTKDERPQRAFTILSTKQNQRKFSVIMVHEHHIVALDRKAKTLVFYTNKGQYERQISLSGMVNQPNSFAISNNGMIYINDRGTESTPTCVKVLTWEGVFVRQFAETNEIVSDAICVDGDGYVCIARLSGDRMDVYGPDDQYVCSFGSPGEDSGYLQCPFQIEMMPDGRVLVVDTGNDRIQIF